MVETAKNVLLILSALFPIVNPLGGSPIFLALTRDYPTSARRALARQVAVNSFILLIASFMVGTHILNFFGISIAVVQVGGGLVVISNGWAMLKQKEEPDRGRDVQRRVDLQDSERVLSFDPAAYGRAGFDLRGHYPRRKLASSPESQFGRQSCHSDWLRGCSGQYLCLLRFCRPPRRCDWRKRHGHCPAALLLSPALHWRADHVEWHERPGTLTGLDGSLIPRPPQH